MKTLFIVAMLLAGGCLLEEDGPGPSPTPQPSPSAVPSPTVMPTASPTPQPQACVPQPPSIGKMQPVIHNRPNPGKVILDVTPKVCDPQYCQAVGFDGRECCPTRPEGDPVRATCDALVLGRNSDGVVGPTWSLVEGPGQLLKHPHNPYLAIMKGSGTVKACANVTPFTCGVAVIVGD